MERKNPEAGTRTAWLARAAVAWLLLSLSSVGMVFIACAQEGHAVPPAEPRWGVQTYWETALPRDPGPDAAAPDAARDPETVGRGRTDKFLWQEGVASPGESEHDGGLDGGPPPP
jgi:hypothetical protein